MAREVQVTFDGADPAALAAFWGEVLGYVLDAPPAGFATWEEALEAWGVPPERRHPGLALEPGGINAGHLVMHDPEGNEFCLD